LPKVAVRELSEVLNSPPTWTWHYELKIDTPKGKVYLTHGKTSSINKLSQNMSCSAVQFHYHSKFYISYWASPVGLFFDANGGCLVDKDHPAMAYGEKSIGKPVLGCLVIKDGRCIPVPMLLSAGGKWSRKL